VRLTWQGSPGTLFFCTALPVNNDYNGIDPVLMAYHSISQSELCQ